MREFAANAAKASGVVVNGGSVRHLMETAPAKKNAVGMKVSAVVADVALVAMDAKAVRRK